MRSVFQLFIWELQMIDTVNITKIIQVPFYLLENL